MVSCAELDIIKGLAELYLRSVKDLCVRLQVTDLGVKDVEFHDLSEWSCRKEKFFTLYSGGFNVDKKLTASDEKRSVFRGPVFTSFVSGTTVHVLVSRSERK